MSWLTGFIFADQWVDPTLWCFKLVHIQLNPKHVWYDNRNSICHTSKNFGMGKVANFANSYLLMFCLQLFLFIISCNYACSSFTNIFFTLQLVLISPFTNILPHPSYGMSIFNCVVCSYFLCDSCCLTVRDLYLLGSLKQAHLQYTHCTERVGLLWSCSITCCT